MSDPPEETKDSVGSEDLRTMAQIREAALALLDPERVDAKVVDADRAHDALDFTFTALDAVLREQRHLELLVQKLRRASAGKSSERVSSEQLRLMFEELVDSMGPDGSPESASGLQEETLADVELDKEIEQSTGADNGADPKKRRKKKVSIEKARKKDHYPKAGEDVRLCPHCGEDRQPIGEEVTTRLEYVPGHFIRHDHHLKKYACPKCKDGVGTTKAPPQVISRSVATPMLLAQVVISKYVDHQPLHRQHRIFARTGVTIPVSTLAEWVARVGDLLAPIVDRLTHRVKGAWIVRTDASGLKVLDPTSPENIEKGTMWCYVGDDRDVVFEFAPTGEGATGPWKFLSGRTGYIQADASSTFDRLFNGMEAQATELGCWFHARRGLVKLKDTDCRVAYPLILIRRLFKLETLADVRRLTHEQRAELRQERCPPVLKKLKVWIVTTLHHEPPGTQMAAAAGYILNHWVALTRFLEDGRISLDNNQCERQFRPLALGRNNYLFAGSYDAAHRMARIFSVVRTCAEHGICPQTYLADILFALAANPTPEEIAELMPERWKARHPPKQE